MAERPNFKRRLLAAEQAFLDICAEVGPCREVSLAKTKLQEARLLVLDYAQGVAEDDTIG